MIFLVDAPMIRGTTSLASPNLEAAQLRRRARGTVATGLEVGDNCGTAPSRSIVGVGTLGSLEAGAGGEPKATGCIHSTERRVRTRSVLSLAWI
jgi:hypothetical protein